jgi:hypothetical protein
MNTTAVGMSIFGLLIVGGLVLAVGQGQKQREQVARYSDSRGYPMLMETDSRLAELLSEALPDVTWSIQRLMLVDGAPPRSYLFGLETRPKEGRATSSNSTGFLAEHRIGRIDSPVVIFSRTPGLDVMMGHGAEVGAQDFRKRYTVSGASARTATSTATGSGSDRRWWWRPWWPW